MKLLSRHALASCALWLGSMASPLSAATSAAPDPNTSQTIQVQVDPRGVEKTVAGEQATTVFVSQIEDLFRRQGYSGAIVAVTHRDLPNEGCVLLTITPESWRKQDDRIDCTYTAVLRTETEALPLGQFRARNLPLAIPPADAANKSEKRNRDRAVRALQELYDAVARTGLVPGLTPGATRSASDLMEASDAPATKPHRNEGR